MTVITGPVIVNPPLEYLVVPGKPHLVQLYCEGCETYSRRVRVPTERDQRQARELTGDPHAIVYPKPPKGWEHGCPRCDR